MSDAGRNRLAVLGSPIHHSKSPAIQRAAYRVLGVDWTYESAEVRGESLASFIGACGPEWRGLSLTMPLKRDVLPLLDRRDPLVDLVGGANTVRFTDQGLAGFNTDVRGAVQSFRDAGVPALDDVLIVGAGATAASMLVAIAELGARRAVVLARSPGKASGLAALGERLGVTVELRPYEVQDATASTPDAVISTVPGWAEVLHFAPEVRARAVLFDIAYDPWPSAQAQAWGEVGGRVISGLELLINQAVGQIRVFLTGDPLEPLPGEAAVVSAMRAAV